MKVEVRHVVGLAVVLVFAALLTTAENELTKYLKWQLRRRGWL